MKQMIDTSFKLSPFPRNRAIHDAKNSSQLNSLVARTRNAGFTLVELLVVIVVIAILAAIIVVSYNGMIERSHDSALKVDINGAAKQIELYRTTYRVLPVSLSELNNGQGIQKGESTSFTYNVSDNDWCVTGTSNKLPDRSYYISSSTKTVQEGVCPGQADNSDALVSTVAGGNTTGSANGMSTTARFKFFNTVDNNYGFGIDVDTDETLYVADTGNNQIRRINSESGVVSTFAGAAGNTGEIITTTASATRFNYPFDVTISTLGGQKMLLIPTANCLRTVRLDLAPYESNMINGGALDFVDGHLECIYATDTTTVEATSATFMSPVSAIHDSSGNLYVNEASAGKLRRLTFNSGANEWENALILSSAGAFSYNSRFGSDLQGNGYGTASNMVKRFNAAGTTTTVAGAATAGFADGAGAQARFNDPRGVDVDDNGNIYVADCLNHRIRKVTPSGNVSTLAGSAQEGYQDGIGALARFGCPSDIAVTPDGSTAYVIDIAVGSNSAAYIRKLEIIRQHIN